jgi:hypothetical protein
VGCGKLGGGVGQDTHLITCAGVLGQNPETKRRWLGLGCCSDTDGRSDGGGW